MSGLTKTDVNNVKTQQVIRENQDVIYSSAVVDVSKKATISVPKSNTYHIIQILDQQNYIVDVVYPGKSLTISPDNLTYGNYVYLNMRIRKLPDTEGGLEATLKLQGMAKIEASSAVPYTTPDIVIDQEKMESIRLALIKDVQAGKAPDTSRAQGGPYQTDPQVHLYATAYGWGGLSLEHAAYLPIMNQTEIKDGKALPSSLTFTPPDIDYDRGGFWSITTYDAEGWMAGTRLPFPIRKQRQIRTGPTRFVSIPQANRITLTHLRHSPFCLRIYVPKSKDGDIPISTEGEQGIGNPIKLILDRSTSRDREIPCCVLVNDPQPTH